MPTRIRRTLRIGEFLARDSYGRWHTVVVFQQFLDASTARDRKAEMPGVKILQTADGRPVYKVSTGVYEILDRARTRIASGVPNAR